MDQKEQVKQYISIVDVASLYVELKPAGKNLKALCPFHTEKTPSFFVMPDRNSFSCYGCNRFGDVFTLVQEMENIGFREAIDFLIDRFHIPVQKSKDSQVKKDDYLQINELAVEYYRSQLRGGGEAEGAREYLNKRGIHAETIEGFAIGFAPTSWDGLTTHLQRKQIALDKAIELGLLIRSEKNRVYDRFRGRIMFPICTETGSPVAFGGRTIAAEEPKYLNSPESPVFKKGSQLFAFHLAKQEIRQKKAAILVEGYLDVITLHQAGIGNAVASLGTALTDRQVYLLKRFTDSIFLYYDSDAAGIQAALRGLEKFFEMGINPRVIVDEDCKDPDEFICKKGAATFATACADAKDGFQFLLLRTSAAFDTSKPERKKAAIDAVMTVVGKIADPIIRDEYIQRTADYFRLDASLLKADPRGRQPVPERLAPLRIGADEREFLTTLLAFPRVVEDIRDLLTPELLSVLAGRSILETILRKTENGQPLDSEAVAKELNDHERALWNQLFVAGVGEIRDFEQAMKVLESCLLNFIKKMNKRDSHRLTREIALFERENQLAQVKKLMTQKSLLKKVIPNPQGGVES